MRVAIYTLGCKVNQYETQAMEAELTGRGHALVPFDGAADAYVINTCTVRGEAAAVLGKAIKLCLECVGIG